MYHVLLALQCIYGYSKEVKMGKGKKEVGRELILAGLLYVNDLVMYGKLKEDLRPMVEHFVEVCRRSLKVNTGKSKVKVLSREEGLEC